VKVRDVLNVLANGADHLLTQGGVRPYRSVV
jgi:hypothetical protein